MRSSGRRVRIAGILMGLIVLLPQAYAQPAATASMNAASIEEMLKAHNELRRARKIRPLHWSISLAESAQQWADHLASIGVMEHNLQLRVGQNLYVISGATARPAMVVRRWAEEAADYSYLSASTGSNCAARVAGTVPNMTPTRVAEVRAMAIDQPEMGSG